ncbi:MAG: InlB B-repeat-containing protein [Lachnospiraceae bacterium]|nr:InlB B-repeat-containing protein [Lachnospiraceae bacterium]
MHFIGWFDKASGGKQYTSTSKAPNQTSLTLYAHYDFNSYKVKFNANGGTGTMTEKTYYYGTEYNLPGNAFKKDGYIFTGWSISEKGSVLYTDKQKVKNLASLNGSTVTLYAQWKEQICKISLNLNGGNGTAQFFGSFDRRVGSVMGEPLKRDPAPPIGMHFVGWYDALKGGTRYTDTSKVPNRETFTLYAHYEYNSYTVRFDANGGKGVMSDKTYDYETEYYLPLNAFEKDGYDFIGWGYGTKGSVSYKDGEKVKNLGSLNGSTVTLYALWKEQICTVTLNLNGGNGTAQFFGPFDRKWGSAMGEPLKRDPAPPLGKCFVGWYDAPTGGTKYTEESKAPDKYSLTLYARYSKVDYTVSFNSRGANGKQYLDAWKITVKYGEPYGKLPDDLTHPNGMRFAGWETAGGELVDEKTEVAIAANHTLYARWENPTSYKIIFDGNGNINGSMDSIECEYDKKTKLPKVLFDNGTGFDYWSTKPDGTGDIILDQDEVYNLATRTQKEVVLYAIWRKGFTIKYHDGISRNVIKTVTNVSHKYACDYKGPAITGLTFAGWITLDYADYLVNAPAIDFEYGKSYPTEKNLNLYPVYKSITKANAVEVIYFMNGAKGNTYVEYQYAEPGKDMVLVKPNQTIPEFSDGRPFGGWSLYRVTWHDLFGPGQEITNYRVGEVVTLYAQGADYECDLVFDYNYPDGKVKTYSGGPYCSIDSPKPLREGYELLGWSKVRNSEVVYPKGASIVVPYGGMTLYAVWQRKMYIVEYYDSLTRKYMFTAKLGIEDKLSSTYEKIEGARFQGWVLETDSYRRVFAPGTEMSVLLDYMPLSEYKLYTSFVFNDLQKGQFPVYYHLRGGVGGPTTISYGDAATGSVVISAIEPTRENGKFIGWSRFPNNNPSYDAGQQIDCSNRDGDYIILYACWESNYTITLNANTTDPKCKETQVIIKDMFPNETLDLSEYRNYFKRDSEYKLIGWGYDTKTFDYARDDLFLVPTKDVTLNAIWTEKEYCISYYDPTTGKKLFDDQYVKKDAQITDKTPVKSDQKFLGWRYSSTAPPLFDFVPGQKFTATRNISLYAVFEEKDEGIPAGFYAVIYDPTLGTGGPGRVLYDVKDTYPCAPTLEPTSKDYKFLGWCSEGENSDEVNFNAGQHFSFTVDERKSIVVHAVWDQKNVNPVGENLQNTYGKSSKAMQDYHFNDNYMSSSWEQINPYAWCVIRTVNKKGSKLKREMETTAAVIEYKLSGKWVLNVYGNGMHEGIWDKFKYDIYCSSTNVGGAVLNFIVTASKTAASIAIPAVGVILTGVDIIDGIMKVIGSKENEETQKLIAETAGIPVDAILENHVENFLNEALAAKSGTKFVAAVEICRSAIEYLVETVKLPSYKNDPFGNYDVAIGKFAERIIPYGLGDYADGISDVVWKIFKNVNYKDLAK